MSRFHIHVLSAAPKEMPTVILKSTVYIQPPAPLNFSCLCEILSTNYAGC